jgi:hypothetical protein
MLMMLMMMMKKKKKQRSQGMVWCISTIAWAGCSTTESRKNGVSQPFRLPPSAIRFTWRWDF